NHRVKIIRSDNGTEFKNSDMLEFCGKKGIKQEYSNAKTLQQNEVAERMNRTLIEDARTMLADSLLPTTFWAEAVFTACYVLNRDQATLRIHNIHPKSQILGDPKSAVQTRSIVQQKSGAYALFSYIQKQQRNNHKDQQHYLPQGMKVNGTNRSTKIKEMKEEWLSEIRPDWWPKVTDRRRVLTMMRFLLLWQEWKLSDYF
ncbi:putative ribonuclease H-like domain-containing protein, partial [Tanacetum coccineum]